MSKERLKMIKNTAFKNRNYDTTKLMHGDVVWLIDQADRAEKSDNALSNCNTDYWTMYSQNKRYREAYEYFKNSIEGAQYTCHAKCQEVIGLPDLEEALFMFELLGVNK